MARAPALAYNRVVLDIIDRYILKVFATYILASLVALLTLFVAVDALSLLVRDAPSLSTLIKYYVYYTPSILYQMFPVACMVGTLFTLSGMNKANELVALFSFGNSLARTSAPILITVAATSVLSFWIGDQVLPVANSKKNYIYYSEIKRKPGHFSTIKTNKIWYRDKNIILNLKTYNAENKIAQGVTFYYFDDNWDLVQLITAKDALVKEDHWTLNDGTITLFTQDSSFPLNQEFQEKVISLENIVEDIQNSTQYTDTLSTRELRRYVQKNKEAGLDTLRYEVDYHGKFGFSFAAFVMSFIGIPFSVQSNRSVGRMKGVAICLGLAFSYWILFSSGLTLGRHGTLPPIIAAWLPNIAMVSVTVFFLLRLKK